MERWMEATLKRDKREKEQRAQEWLSSSVNILIYEQRPAQAHPIPPTPPTQSERATDGVGVEERWEEWDCRDQRWGPTNIVLSQGTRETVSRLTDKQHRANRANYNSPVSALRFLHKLDMVADLQREVSAFTRLIGGGGGRGGERGGEREAAGDHCLLSSRLYSRKGDEGEEERNR
ncbi:hypothetical protein EYF80_011852 [Liparis tanakae]|uniref:Uncharacterized protein n=1 Tax=Liparis tanakae TaxID=230148 RepID=A0A4Z2IIX9_9TELE|nr:hypothetical protein EYF80_011852 [Liparis tanakae]